MESVSGYRLGSDQVTKLKASPRRSWLRVRENKKENISVLFNLFLFCFISNSKSKFENSHCFLLIIFFKVIFAEFSKPNIFLILGWSISLRGSVLPYRYCWPVSTRFRLFVDIFRQLNVLFFTYKLCFEYLLTTCFIRFMEFAEIFFLNKFEFSRQNFLPIQPGNFS